MSDYEVALSEYDRDSLENQARLLSEVNEKLANCLMPNRMAIAAMCMQGLVSKVGMENSDPPFHFLAFKAVRAADCLLAELNK